MLGGCWMVCLDAVEEISSICLPGPHWDADPPVCQIIPNHSTSQHKEICV